MPLKFGENPMTFTQVIIQKQMCLGEITRNLPTSNPKSDLHNTNAHTKFGENPLIFTQVIMRKRKYRQMYNRWRDRQTHGWPTRYHNTLPLLCGRV